MMKYSFLKEEKIDLRTQLTFKDLLLEIYIPESYMSGTKSAMARQIGENIETIGLFLFKFKDKVYKLSYPIKMMFSFSEKYKWSGRLKPGIEADDYIVFKLKPGDAFCYDLNHMEDPDDLVFFISKLIEEGKMPKIISYDSILPLLINAMEASGYIGLGVSSTTYELLISELFRNKNKIVEAFRFYINNNPKAMYNYKQVKLNKLPELTSTFTGIMGEDSKQQIAAAILHNRENREEKTSPMEKLIKF